MGLSRRWMGAVLAAALLASGCAGAEVAASDHNEPATVETPAGSDVGRLTLTKRAAERIDIGTTMVASATPVAGRPRVVIPYSAVIYDPSGATWAYTNPQPLVYQRHPITIDVIESDRAFLFAGPPVGTPVVSVGAAELYGTEFGVGK